LTTLLATKCDGNSSPKSSESSPNENPKPYPKEPSVNNRYVKDGKVAVLVSPGFGGGWSTWIHQYPEIVFAPEIAKALDEKRPIAEIYKLAEELYPEAYLGGLEDLEIVWLDPGDTFRIDEYDGSESLEYMSKIEYYTA
jgi:hypothetical protein